MQIHFTKTHSTVNTHKRIKLDALHLKNIYLYAHIFLSMRVVCVCVCLCIKNILYTAICPGLCPINTRALQLFGYFFF